MLKAIGLFIVLTLFSLFVSNAFAQPSSSLPSPSFRPSVLALTKAKEWAHASRINAAALLERHAVDRGWNLTVSADHDEYFSSSESLQGFDVIVFLLTTGPIFSEFQKKLFREYVNRGGAVVGVHSAVDTNRDWPFHVTLFGAEFANHPKVQWARLRTRNREHPTTSFLPLTWQMEEEYYNFPKPLRLDDKNVLLTVDEDSYKGGNHGAMHPISWTRYHMPAGSRVWYTALGHLPRAYSGNGWPERHFQLHVALGIEWAAKGTAVARKRAIELLDDLGPSVEA